jgi:hypothetical protein
VIDANAKFRMSAKDDPITVQNKTGARAKAAERRVVEIRYGKPQIDTGQRQVSKSST